MFNFLRKKPEKEGIVGVAKQQLKENRAIIESLRDYDTGKKDISTRDVERRLPNVRVTP